MDKKIKLSPLSIFIVFLMVPLSGASIDIYVPSLPAITDFFHIKDTLVQLTITTYLIGFALSQIIFGTLSDAYGRKKILLYSTLCFCIFSLLAPLSTSIYMLLSVRFFQGVFASAASVISKAIISDVFSGKTLQKYVNYNTICWASGPIIAPFIGGYLQHYFGWRAPFYFLSGYGVLIFITSLLWLPETHFKRTPLNLKNTINNIKTILSNDIFGASTVLLSLMYSLITLFNVIGPFLIQVVLGYSAVVYGHMALWLGLAWFLGNITNRLLTSRHHTNYIIRTAITVALFASIIMVFLSFYWVGLAVIMLPVFTILFCGGVVYPNCLGKCLSLFPEIGGTSAAVLGSFISVGSSLLTGVGSLLKTHNQMPLASAYVIILFTCFAVYRTILRPKFIEEHII